MTRFITPLLLFLAVLAALQTVPPASRNNRRSNRADNGNIEIQPLNPEKQNAEPVLTLKDEAQVSLVNMIPADDSGEERQDSQPTLTVHPDRQLMVGAAYYSVAEQDKRKTLPLYLSTDGDAVGSLNGSSRSASWATNLTASPATAKNFMARFSA